MSGPMTSMAAMRSFRRDPSVTARELPKGTVRRILGIARPYRRELVFFLLLVVASSVIGVITPLLAGDIVNRIARLDGTAGGGGPVAPGHPRGAGGGARLFPGTPPVFS